MLLIESVKELKIASTRNSRCHGEPTVFAMLVCDQTGYAHEIEFSDVNEVQGFVDAVNALTKS